MNTLWSRTRELVAKGGYWSAAMDPLIESAPEFVEAYLAFGGAPHRAPHLTQKDRAFISLALDAATTHLHEPGIRRHCRAAVRAGATRAELLEVLELTATMGVHACVMGVPILVEKLDQTGIPLDLANSDDVRKRLKSEFIAKRGYWNVIWDGLLALDPSFFESFVNFSSVPWQYGTLAPKIKEFIYIALDVSVHHQFVTGTHIHIANALKYGASPQELLEVMQIASVLGMKTFEIALPIVEEELATASRTPSEPAK